MASKGTDCPLPLYQVSEWATDSNKENNGNLAGRRMNTAIVRDNSFCYTHCTTVLYLTVCDVSLFILIWISEDKKFISANLSE